MTADLSAGMLAGEGAHRAVTAVDGDLTTTKSLIEALQRNEERLAYATTVAQVGLFEHYLQPLPPPLPWWSPSLRALLGYGANEPPDFGWYHARIHPEDLGVLASAMAAASDPTGDGRVAVEYRFRHPEKGYRWLLIRSATLMEEIDGRRAPVRALGAIIDVTEQRVTEEDRQRRAAILEATPDYVAIADLQGQIVDLNPSARALLGVEPAAEIEGLTLSQLLEPSHVEHLRHRAIPTAMASGTWSGDSEFRRYDGVSVPVAQRIIVHRDGSGAPCYLSTIARDLTKEKRLEEQFRQSQKMEALGRLAGGVAHDFNNLLSVIFGCAELARNGLADGHTSHEWLAEIIRAAERAASLTGQLLAFGRRQIMMPRVIDVNQALAEFHPMLSRLVDERIEVQMIAEQGTANILADPNQLQQVLLNLAVNARDAMPQGGVLTLEAFRSTLEGGEVAQKLDLPAGAYIVVAVSDTGHGMDQATRERIFEPFFTTKSAQAGSGLGLSMVLGIVQQSGGNVWVYSEPGRGTTFKVYFPSTDRTPEQTVSAPPVTLVGRTGTVLVAEDDEQVRNMVGNVLSRAGFQVLLAADSEQALALAADNEVIDLLLTDVVMPKSSGEALAARLRERRPDLPVLFTSGYTEGAIVNHGVLQQGVNFLPKPVTPGRLLAAIGEVFQQNKPPE